MMGPMSKFVDYNECASGGREANVCLYKVIICLKSTGNGFGLCANELLKLYLILDIWRRRMDLMDLGGGKSLAAKMLLFY